MSKAFQTNEPSQICETRAHPLRQTGLTTPTSLTKKP